VRICNFAKWTSFDFECAFGTHQVIAAVVALVSNWPDAVMQTVVVKNHVVTNCALNFAVNQLGIQI